VVETHRVFVRNSRENCYPFLMLKRFSKRYRIVVYSIRATKCTLATDAFNRIEVSDLPPIIRNFIGLISNESIGTIQENEISLLQNALEECNWNKKLAARRLGVSRATLYNKLKKYQITQPTIQ